MPLTTKITPYSQSYQVLVEQTLSPKARGDRIAAGARQIIAAADAKNRSAFGAVPPKKVTVNGREDDVLATVPVPPDSGHIVVEYRLVEDVLAWIMKTLRERSPARSGKYRSAHQMFADDVAADPDNPPMASQYVFTNSVPYTRKIEAGKTESGRAFVIQVPNRIYERTANDAQAKFGNVAKIRFTHQSLRGGAIGQWASSASAQAHAHRHGRRSKSTEWLTRQPAILVTIG
jgi:hypothetical protein